MAENCSRLGISVVTGHVISQHENYVTGIKKNYRVKKKITVQENKLKIRKSRNNSFQVSNTGWRHAIHYIKKITKKNQQRRTIIIIIIIISPYLLNCWDNSFKSTSESAALFFWKTISANRCSGDVKGFPRL